MDGHLKCHLRSELGPQFGDTTLKWYQWVRLYIDLDFLETKNCFRIEIVNMLHPWLWELYFDRPNKLYFNTTCISPLKIVCKVTHRLQRF